MIMKTRLVLSFFGLLLFAACSKKTNERPLEAAKAVGAVILNDCGKEIITDKPVKARQTGIVLPAGTKLCFTTDNLEIRVTLPVGYTFLTAVEAGKASPPYATYTCSCSGEGSHCQVFYADGLGFGCLQSTCSGSCTGRFTYGGYIVDQVVPTTNKTSFFGLPEVQKEIIRVCDADTTNLDWVKENVFGVSFYLVRTEELFKTKATCDCEGTQACKLKTLGLQQYKIYYCDGPCNGCELTVK
jgi:hypothetical protein